VYKLCEEFRSASILYFFLCFRLVGYFGVLGDKVTGKVANAIYNFLSFWDSKNGFALKSRRGQLSRAGFPGKLRSQFPPGYAERIGIVHTLPSFGTIWFRQLRKSPGK
jgi:hypothetical protein